MKKYACISHEDAESLFVNLVRELTTLCEDCKITSTGTGSRLTAVIEVSVPGRKVGHNAPCITLEVHPGLECTWRVDKAARITLQGTQLSPHFGGRSFHRRYLIRQDLSYNPKIGRTVATEVKAIRKQHEIQHECNKQAADAMQRADAAMESAGWVRDDENPWDKTWRREGCNWKFLITDASTDTYVNVRVSEHYRRQTFCLPEDAPRAANMWLALLEEEKALAERRGAIKEQEDIEP